MPNRIIKDSIHESEDVNKMTDFQFRLWVNLIAYVDDYGRGDARPAIIKGKCFPLMDIPLSKIEFALVDLAEIGVIRLYESEGKPLLFFPKWELHQTVRNKKSKYPKPDDSAIESNCKQTQANVPVIQSNPIQSNTNPNTNTSITRTKAFVPPTLEEVTAYCQQRNSSVDPQKFYDYFSAGDWKDSEGKPVKSWKQKIITWEGREKRGKPVSGNAEKSTGRFDSVKYDNE